MIELLIGLFRNFTLPIKRDPVVLAAMGGGASFIIHKASLLLMIDPISIIGIVSSTGIVFGTLTAIFGFIFMLKKEIKNLKGK